MYLTIHLLILNTSLTFVLLCFPALFGPWLLHNGVHPPQEDSQTPWSNFQSDTQVMYLTNSSTTQSNTIFHIFTLLNMNSWYPKVPFLPYSVDQFKTQEDLVSFRNPMLITSGKPTSWKSWLFLCVHFGYLNSTVFYIQRFSAYLSVSFPDCESRVETSTISEFPAPNTT